MISRELVEAYRNTCYRAQIDGETVEIRVGARHPRLDELLCGRHWAFVSAENPGSQPTPEQNPANHRRLVSEVDACGYRSYPGLGISDSGSWPPEASLLLIGIDRQAAVDLARRFGQNAIVYGEAGAAAQLVFCR